MDNRVIAEKYEIIDTLFSNELQTTYTAKISGTDDSKRFIINEFKDTDIIYSMKDNFSREKCRYIRNIIDTFYVDFCFYVVCNICSGPILETFLSDNNLRLTEKMYLTESLFIQLTEMDKLSPFIGYSLCEADNIAVTNKRNICFNCNLKLTEDTMKVSAGDVLRRAGEIICAVFSNTVNADLSYAKDNMPPALFPIVQNCLDGKYTSAAKAYNDFKSLLLYSVFMGNRSVDNQIMKGLQKAKIKRRLTPLRRLAVIVIILLLAGGVWAIVKDLDISTMNKNKAEVQNTKPTAYFAASKELVFVGDKVSFTNQSSDPDSSDSIKSYLWVISKDDDPIFNSTSRDISYTFNAAGNYGVHLVVADSHEEASEPYKAFINVLSKPNDDDKGEEGENNK